jgi:hypothetical protein
MDHDERNFNTMEAYAVPFVSCALVKRLSLRDKPA